MSQLSIFLPDDLFDFLDRQSDDPQNPIVALLQEWRDRQERDNELAEACAVVDELNLGWSEEWQNAAIYDRP